MTRLPGLTFVSAASGHPLGHPLTRHTHANLEARGSCTFIITTKINRARGGALLSHLHQHLHPATQHYKNNTLRIIVGTPEGFCELKIFGKKDPFKELFVVNGMFCNSTCFNVARALTSMSTSATLQLQPTISCPTYNLHRCSSMGHHFVGWNDSPGAVRARLRGDVIDVNRELQQEGSA